MRRIQVWRGGGGGAYVVQAQHSKGKPFRRVKMLAGVGLQGAVQGFGEFVRKVVTADAWDRTRYGERLRLVGPDGRTIDKVDVEKRRREMMGTAGTVACELAEGRVADAVANPKSED